MKAKTLIATLRDIFYRISDIIVSPDNNYIILASKRKNIKISSISLQFKSFCRKLKIQSFLYAETSLSWVIDSLKVSCELNMRLVDMQVIFDAKPIFSPISPKGPSMNFILALLRSPKVTE